MPRLVTACIDAGMTVVVATTDDDGRGRRGDVPLARAVRAENGSTLHHFPRQVEFYTVSLPLWNWLRRHVKEFDVVHVHALFSFPSIVAARESRRSGVPYVIRPLGVLNRWGLENRRRLLKRASLHALELPSVRHAAAMHYTSQREEEEAQSVHPLIRRARACIIPLPIDVPEAAEPAATQSFLSRFPQLVGRPVVLFLSRIDAKKGIELLLEAFSRVTCEAPDAFLMLAGDGEDGYGRELRGIADRLGIASRLVWPGFLAGAEKRAAFALATAFVLPSHSENFGIAAAEALAAGVPVLLTDQVAVADDVVESNAGLVVPCDAAAIAAALRKLLADAALRNDLASRGHALVVNRYSSHAVGQQLKALYQSVMQQPRSRS